MTTIVCSKCGTEKDKEMFGLYRAHSTGRRPDCRTCRSAVAKAWRESHPMEHSIAAKQWQKRSPEKVAKIQKSYRDKTRERSRAASRKWQKANKTQGAALAAKRRALCEKATPSWASKAYINIFYEMAAHEAKRTGRAVHVDHIYPLNSPLVCGLHVEDNPQLLFAVDNIRKKNRLPKLGEASSQQ